jgi:hypothetical protein
MATLTKEVKNFSLPQNAKSEAVETENGVKAEHEKRKEVKIIQPKTYDVVIHNWRKHANGMVFLNTNGVFKKVIAICNNFRPNIGWRYEYIIRHNGSVYTLKEFYLQFKDKGLVIGRSAVVQALKIFLRNKKSGKDKKFNNRMRRKLHVKQRNNANPTPLPAHLHRESYPHYFQADKGTKQLLIARQEYQPYYNNKHGYGCDRDWHNGPWTKAPSRFSEYY